MRMRSCIPTAIASALVCASTNGHAKQTRPDIIDKATAAGNFSTLISAVKAADLVDTLKGDGPFTVFAPTDGAFAKIPSAQLKALLADKQELTRVLTYHVVPGKIMAQEVMNMGQASTVQGQSVDIRVESNKVFVDEAQIMANDIKASNGIIHAIDTVIMPDQENAH